MNDGKRKTPPLRFEVWQLGSARDTDVCVARFANMPDAVREVMRRLAKSDDESYEVRELGKPVEAPGYDPPSVRRRGTSPGKKTEG